MNIFSSYKVKIKHYNKIFNQTVEVYRNAVSFFIDICDKEWDRLKDLRSLEQCREIERLSLSTKKIQIQSMILISISIKCHHICVGQLSIQR